MEEEMKNKRVKFCVNDHADVVVEILRRLDDRSLGVSACVCRLWCSITRNDAFWEKLCFRQLLPPPRVRPVVVALGGYKRLYMVCVRRVLSRLGRNWDESSRRRVWTREEVQLSLSLFCVDCYEKLGSGRLNGGGSGGGGGVGDGSVSSSLMFLCKPVNV